MTVPIAEFSATVLAVRERSVGASLTSVTEIQKSFSV